MEKATVLIMEDDPVIRELYRDALAAADLDVLEAKDGKVGVELALKHRPRVILVDILMPNMNGHEAVQAIRKDAWGKDVPIIYLTNLSDPADVVHAIEQGPEEYIVKANTDIKVVVNKVRTAMYKK